MRGIAVEMEHCHLWLARFADRAEVDDYFEETVPYPDDAPINRFAADQGERFYDHDWVFTEFREDGDLGMILETVRAPAGTGDAVRAAAAVLGFVPNALIAADEGEIDDPRSVAGRPRLAYVGCLALWARG